MWSWDPLILYSNRVLPLFVLAMTVTLSCLQEAKNWLFTLFLLLLLFERANTRLIVNVLTVVHLCLGAYPVVQSVKNPSAMQEIACSTGDPVSIPRSGRSLGEGNGDPLQYSCLENPMDRGTWRATVHEVTKSQIQLGNWTTTIVLSQEMQTADWL